MFFDYCHSYSYNILTIISHKTSLAKHMTIEQIVAKMQENHPQVDTKLIVQAYEFAKRAHGDQKRKTGEPYIIHPMHTAYILIQIKADLPTVIAGLLHDVPEDTSTTIEEVEATFGAEVAMLVNGVTKLSKVKYRGVERYRESLRKMFLAMAEDLRVVLIKFADRLHNLRTLDAVETKSKIKTARETLEIYAPIAGLLGVWSLKWQMEDLCFKYLYPEEYKAVEYRYEIERKVELNQYIQKLKLILAAELNKVGIEHNIEGRFKHLYSIWKKMSDKNRKFDDIHDVFALRVIVNNISDCYKVLGIIHSLWTPNYNRFKDYIAVPKPNGYRSLHTTVFGVNGKSTEFQIRTKEMHDEALYGVSAHFSYKEKNQKPLRWVKEILDLQRDIKDTGEFISQAKINIFQNRIFVFTPKGDVYDLPADATPVDFAYAVHTDIGNKCTAAMVNNKMSKLDQKLANGDTVEIILDQSRRRPNADWLKFVATKRAKDKIKAQTRKFSLERLRKMVPGLNK